MRWVTRAIALAGGALLIGGVACAPVVLANDVDLVLTLGVFGAAVLAVGALATIAALVGIAFAKDAALPAPRTMLAVLLLAPPAIYFAARLGVPTGRFRPEALVALALVFVAAIGLALLTARRWSRRARA